MALKTYSIYTNFRQGELSPRLFGRVDWERYISGCVTLENFIILPQGGIQRRPGTRFVAEVKDSNRPARLVPFRVDDDNVYVLEIGNGYVRFYKNGAQLTSASVPYELAAPWSDTYLFQIHYAQAEDSLVLVHRTFAPRSLSRYADTSWRLATVAFDPPATEELGKISDATHGGTLTPANTTGTGVQFDTSANMFLASDVGRQIIVTTDGSVATIKTVANETRVTADIEHDFPSVNAVGVGNWKVDGSPLTTCTANAASPIGATITLTLGANGWRDVDANNYVLMDGGMAKITAMVNATVANATIVREFEGTNAQPAYSWSIERPAWSAERGYPGTVGFFEGRMLMGGTTYAPNSVYGSASFDYFDFFPGSTDDAALNFRTTSGERSTVRWFSPRRQLLLGTASDEFLLTGGNDAAITPTNRRMRPATPHGSGYIMPIRSEHATLFVPSNGRILRELAYAYDVDDYRAPNLLDTAEHLTAQYTIVDMAYQRPPDSILWLPRADGTLLGCTYLREQDLVGWYRMVTDGSVESVCTIPSQDGTTDQVWMVVNRTIGGRTKRYIEYFDSEYAGQFANAPGLVTDSAVIYDATPTDTVTGLSHLEGKTASIVGDGTVFPDAVVTGGQVTLVGGTASKIEVGLPFTSTLVTMRPELNANGTTQGRPKAWPEITARFINTIGGQINGQQIKAPAPPVLFTGDKKVVNLGWDADGWITVTQTQPLPMTLSCIYGTLAVGEG